MRMYTYIYIYILMFICVYVIDECICTKSNKILNTKCNPHLVDLFTYNSNLFKAEYREVAVM